MASDTYVFRYSVPVDDQWHEILLTGDILHVDARSDSVVEFWALGTDNAARTESFRVYGTGHKLADDVTHVGSVIVAGGALAWHLFRKVGEPS